ncbi:MAG TPA: hypothetical protein VL572_08235 [Pyrinomonadaceae bacterium]|nr:hypothetical protein [Pyrinomonadaceae bacterium]
MGKYVVEIDKQPFTASGARSTSTGQATAARKRSLLKTVAITVLITFVTVAVAAGMGSYLYWQHLKTTPQYSLALMIDAAKRDDAAKVGELVDIDAVVDDFLPQITGKAIELYGRNLPPDTLQRVARIAGPVMPAVKDRARDELPGAIRQKTAAFGDVPFAAMVLGADTYLDIKVEGERATVRSKVPEHDFEVRMVRTGDLWKIAGVRDEELATRIAQRVGQEILAIAVNGTGSKQSRLGIRNINELLRQAEEIFR